MKPILFNTTMVRAILDGRKTVTRRVVKPQPGEELAYIWGGSNNGKWSYSPYNEARYDEHRKAGDWKYWAPPFHADDVLWVRETLYYDAYAAFTQKYFYKADYENKPKWVARVVPSIHMPKEAARLFLRVTNIRVEKLQDMTIDDANKEGISLSFLRAVTEGNGSTTEDYSLETFETIWDSTIKKCDIAKYGWFANPYVWVIEFERCMMQEGNNDYERTD